MTLAASAWISILLASICLLVGIRGEAASEATQIPQANATGPTPVPKFNCIVCDDLTNKDTCEPWDHFSHSVDCYTDSRIDKSKPVGCRKMVQSIKDKTYVSRQCTNLVDNHLQGCIDRVGTKKIKVLYCHCRTPDCNSATRFAAPSSSWALALLWPALQFGFVAR